MATACDGTNAPRRASRQAERAGTNTESAEGVRDGSRIAETGEARLGAAPEIQPAYQWVLRPVRRALASTIIKCEDTRCKH